MRAPHDTNALSNMPASTNPDCIDWRNSPCKVIIMNDLRSGLLPVDEEEVSAEEAWEHCSNLPDFVGLGVIFDQFKKRLADHRKQVGARVKRAMWDSAACEHDILKHPHPSHNHRGQRNFHLSPAEKLLREDVRAGHHLGLCPSELQLTRDECKAFSFPLK